MKKTFSSLVCAAVSLTVIMLACGEEPRPPPGPLPLADGGVLWADCDASRDGGGCAPGETCLFVEPYARDVCVRTCDAQTACEHPESACCLGEADGGTSGYCLPQEVCDSADAGTDGGADGGQTEGTSDAGGLTDGGADAGTGTDAGGGATDAGFDAGTGVVDAGMGVDAGTGIDAGTGGTDAGTGGTDAGSGGTDAGTGGTDAGTGGTDAGTGGTDAGTGVDAGTGGTDAGPGTDAGVDAGTDAGTRTDAGVDAGTGGPDAGTGGTDAGTGTGYTNIRIMASNLTSENGQNYDYGHGIRLMQGVKPDVVLIQEFNYRGNTADDVRAMVDLIGPGFYYYREGGAQIPNGVISRWPIVASGEWDDPRVTNRDFAWARIDIPGPRDLWAVSVHLLTANATERQLEAASLVNQMRDAGIPDTDYVVIGGDLNTKSRSEACFNTLSQMVTTAGPYPADRNGNVNTSADRDDPYDHVLVDGDLRPHQQATVIRAANGSSSSTFTNGLVLDSRVYSPLSEISPALSGDSGARNMQHMGVVKDFRVPNN